MRTKILIALCFAALGTGTASRGEEKDPGAKDQYPGLDRLIHEMVVARIPKEFEDRSAAKVVLPRKRLPRKALPPTESPALRNGVLKRTRVWFDDPAKDVVVKVRSIRREKSGTWLRIETIAALHGERERERWREGVKRFGITTYADAVVALALDCKVVTSLDRTALLPRLHVEATVTDVRLTLQEFDLRRVGNLLEGEQAREVGNEFKGTLEQLLRRREPDVKDYLNQAIATALTDGSAAPFLGRGKSADDPPSANDQ